MTKKILKVARRFKKKKNMYKGIKIRKTAHFLSQTTQARMQGSDIFKVQKINNFQKQK